MSFLPTDPELKLLYVNTTTKPGDTIANTTAQTNFASSFPILANSLKVGQRLLIQGSGLYSTPALLGGTTVARIKLGGNAIITSPALNNVMGASNLGYTFQASIIVRAVGSSGSIDAQGYMLFDTTQTSATPIVIPNAADILLNTTVDQLLQLSTQFSVANAGVTNTLRQLIVYSAGPASMST